MNAAVSSAQRHSKNAPCLICGGCQGDPRGKGIRCEGYRSEDDNYTHCARPEHAGSIDANGAGLFAHRMHGECNCGTSHGADKQTSSGTTERYPYCNEIGGVVYRVCVRGHGKTKKIWQDHPDGAGGFLKGRGDAPRTLYRLPELVASKPDAVVHVCEGERDCETVRSKGHVATTNPEGAGKFHYVAETARRVLASRDVIVTADDDEAGRRHARQVEAALRPVVRSIRVVVPPAPYKDVTDLLTAGGTLDQLLPLDPEDEAMPDDSFFGADTDGEVDNVVPITKAKPRPKKREVPDDGREKIFLTADTHKVTEAMCRVLAGDPGLYHRDRKLVDVVASAEVRNRETVLVAEGTPQPRELPLSGLIDRVSSLALCMAFDAREGGFVHKAPNKDRVRAVLEKGSWRGVPELVAIIEGPSLRPDGTLIQEPGYDAATRFLYAPSTSFPRVPDAPTEAQAVRALADLGEVYCDFPHVDAAHRSAALALPITLVARPAIEGPVPAWLFDASARRSGKTKQVDAANIIATGRPAGRSIFPSSKNVDELAKLMAGHAQAGTPLIYFDNVPARQVFGGPVLDAWITAEGRANFRVLGKTGDHEVEWRSVIAASGNGIECGDDLGPRVLAPRLESPLENPELRSDFKHDPLLPWVKANRPRLVVAILTLLRAYVVAGRPDMKLPRWGSFDAWVGLVANAMVWAGAADPMGARKKEAEDDPTLTAERVIVANWTTVANEAGKDSLTAAQYIAAVYAPRRAEGSPLDVGPIREAVEYLTHTKPGCAPDSKRLGKILRGLKHRNVRGYAMTTDGETGGVARWKTKRAGQ